MERQKIRQYLSLHPEFVKFLYWLADFKHPILKYPRLKVKVEEIMDEPLALIPEKLNG